MKKFGLLLLIILGLFSFNKLSAQDIITTKDGVEHKVKIKEVTDLVIKYTSYNDPDGIIFSMGRGLISEIEYENSHKEIEVSPIVNELYFIEDRRNNIKFSYTSLISDVMSLTYERSLNPSASIETTLKYHGIGVSDNNNNRTGFGVAFGYKLKFSNLFSPGDGYRPGHILSGGFMRPSLGFDIIKDEEVRRNRSFDLFHLGMDFGFQTVFRNAVSLEVFGGPHFNTRIFGNNTQGGDYYNENTFAAGEIFGISDGIGASFGFRMGLLFGKKKEEEKLRKRVR